jgi:hypothetical protein
MTGRSRWARGRCRLLGHGQADAAVAEDGDKMFALGQKAGGQGVHRGSTHEARDEQICGAVVDRVGVGELLRLALVHHDDTGS